MQPTVAAVKRTRFSPILAVLLTVSVLYLAREIFIPLALAALISFLLSPLVKRLESWHVGSVLSVCAVLTLALASVAFVGWMVTNQLVDVINQVPAYEDNIHQKFESLLHGKSNGVAKLKTNVQEISKELSATATDETESNPPNTQPSLGRNGRPARPIAVEVVEPPATVLQAARAIVGPLIVPLGTTLVVIVFTAFILLHRGDLRDRLIRLTAPRELNMMTQAFDDATERVTRYLLMQFVVNTVFGALVATGLYFVGLPNALLWGVLAGVLRFIPYLGPIVGGTLPIILAFAVFPGWVQPLQVLGLFVIIEFATANLVEPWAYGSRTGVSPLAILVAAVFWTTLWGPIGLMLSTPLTVCVVVLGRYVPQLGFLHVLLGDDPVLPPAAQFYQRLLALDRHEAREVLLAFLKQNTPLALYDTVILPALAMAEEDRHKGALEPTREEFVVQSIDELVWEVPQIIADLPPAETPAETMETEQIQTGNASIASTLAVESTTAHSRNILCVAAADHADEIVAAMLAQLLDQSGHNATCIPASESRSLTMDNAHSESDRPIDIVFISALPPFALLSARTSSKRMRAQFPNAEIVVGLWTLATNSARSDDRLGKAFTYPVVTTLAEAIAHADHQPNEAEPHQQDPVFADLGKSGA